MPSDWQLRTNYGKGYGKDKGVLWGPPLKNPKPDWTDSCFIATAAYGTEICNELDVLREFRDTHLRVNIVGRNLVKMYYRISPPIANYIRYKGKIRWLIRFVLNHLIKLLK